MLAFLGALPLIGSIVTGFTTALFNAKVKLVQARTGADRDTAVEMVKSAALADHENTTRLSIFASNPLLTFMLIGFALPLIVYCWKIIVVDIVIGPGCVGFAPFSYVIIADHCWKGSTDPIRGDVAAWATTIIGFLFGSSALLGIGKMYFGRDKTGE